ncbi:uncharacterized protein LOC144101677 [Amblyomma americanum]
MQPPAPGAVNEAAMGQQMDLKPPTQTSMTSMSTTIDWRTHLEAKQRVQSARTKLIVAAAALVSVLLIGAIWLVLKTEPTQDGATFETDLTYRELVTTPTQLVTTTADMQTTMETTTKGRPALDVSTLLCTYGTETNTTTMFPEDGVCDLIFFDSAYKKYINVPTQEDTFGEGMKAFLAAASRYESTEFGVAFAYLYRDSLTTDLRKTNPTMLEVFWRSGVFHFGIIDMPASDVSHDNIRGVFTLLKDLSIVAMKRPDTLGQPHIVLGAVPQNHAEFYALRMKNVYTPTLFISQGHYAFGDNTKPGCRVTPPTMLLKTPAFEGYTYDLTDAVSALQRIHHTGASTKLLVSFSMKGRWTVVKPSFPLELSSECYSDRSAEPFGAYVEVCTDAGFVKHLNFVPKFEAMYTYDRAYRTMFVYDNEEGLCRKMCQLNSQNHPLKFGIAVYDLEYDDYNNTCSDLNIYGEFSRLKMVRKVVEYFRSSLAGSGGCEYDVPCPSDLEAKQRVESARKKLVAAAAALLFVILVGAITMVVSTKPTEDEGALETDLTYREPATTPKEPDTTTADMETTMETTTKRRPALDASTLMCTYGTETNTTTMFPEDGVCDLIFFDSAYKKYINVPTQPQTFGTGMKSFLAAASRYESTEFGVAFAYLYIDRLTADVKRTNPTMLEVFWRSGVFHFGIIDMPASGVSHDNIRGVFTLLKELSIVAMKRPDTLGQPHIVLGAVPQNHAEFYALRMRSVYTPTLFISQGHYAFGDNTVPGCKVFPPTMLLKPAASQDYSYDLTDAVSALQRIQETGASTKLLVSFSMKGRWTVVKPSFPLELSSECYADQSAKPFGTYVEVCTDAGLAKRLNYVQKVEAMYTYDRAHRTMFVYDNEEGLCRKMCQLKSQNDRLKFGIAIYDLEYDDYNNSCSDLNIYGAFSRLKMVRKVVEHFRSSLAGSGGCEYDVPCPSGASA